MEEEKVVNEEGNEGFTLLELFNILKNNILLLILIVIGFFVVGLIYTKYVVTPMYTSSIDLYIRIEHDDKSGNDNAKAVTARQVASNIKEFIKFPDLIREVINENDLSHSVTKIQNNVRTSSRGEATAVVIIYEDSDPLVASLVVQKLAEKLRDRINLDSDDPQSLKFASETIKIINYPISNPNQSPSSPNLLLNLIISIMLGGIVGVVIVILKEQFSTKYSSRTEVERILKLPVLALIPRNEVGEQNGK